MDLELHGKVALIGAASKGLGKAAALAMGAEGAKLAICARSELIESAADEVRAATGAEVLAGQVDLTQQSEVDGFVQQALKEFGQIDILIANSGGPPPGDFMDLSIADWESGIQTTIMSTLYLCYAVVPHMLER